MENLRLYISAELKAQFDVSYEEALRLYELTERDRDTYTIEFNKLIKKLGIE
jgi:hypothetical protein